MEDIRYRGSRLYELQGVLSFRFLEKEKKEKKRKERKDDPCKNRKAISADK